MDASAAQPDSDLPPLDATIEMERPADLRQPVKIEMPAANQSGPDVTLELERPEDVKQYRPERRKSDIDSGILQVEVLHPLPAYAMKLGEVLVQMGKLSTEQVEEAVVWARDSGERLGHGLIRWGLVTPDVVCRALSIQTGLPMTLLEPGAVPETLSKLFPLALMMHHNFVPFDSSPSVICIAACSPLESETLKELERLSKKVVEVFLAREDQVDRQIDMLRIKLKTRSRRLLRFEKQISCAFQFCSRQGVRTGKQVCTGQTVNVSEGGFLIDTPAPEIADPADAMRRGMYINLCLKLPDMELWSICEAREIRMSDVEHPGSAPAQHWLMGVEIIDMSPELRKKLKAFCKP